MKIRYVFLFLATTAILTGCDPKGVTPSTPKPAKPFEIEFVALGDTKLKIVTPDIGCGKSEDGCMKVPTANSGEITFKFQNTQQLPCSDHHNSWILSKIELANIEGGFEKPVNEWIVEDFGADPGNGLVWQKSAGQEITSHTITDLNNSSGDVYYRITAESCDPDKGPINSDPRVINEG